MRIKSYTYIFVVVVCILHRFLILCHQIPNILGKQKNPSSFSNNSVLIDFRNMLVFVLYIFCIDRCTDVHMYRCTRDALLHHTTANMCYACVVVFFFTLNTLWPFDLWPRSWTQSCVSTGHLFWSPFSVYSRTLYLWNSLEVSSELELCDCKLLAVKERNRH